MSNIPGICSPSLARGMKKKLISPQPWFQVRLLESHLPSSAQQSVTNLQKTPTVVYFLVIFSIVVHGLSIPALNIFYKWRGVPSIQEDDAVEIQLLSTNQSLPKNSSVSHRRRSVTINNRFSRHNSIHQQPPLQISKPMPATQTFRLGERKGQGSDEELGYRAEDSRFESTDSIIKLKEMV